MLKRLGILMSVFFSLQASALDAECSKWTKRPVLFRCSNGQSYVYGKTDCVVEGKKASFAFCKLDQKDDLEDCITSHLVFNQMMGNKCYTEYKSKRPASRTAANSNKANRSPASQF